MEPHYYLEPHYSLYDQEPQNKLDQDAKLTVTAIYYPFTFITGLPTQYHLNTPAEMLYNSWGLAVTCQVNTIVPGGYACLTM